MKHKIIAMVLTICFLFASFSVGFNATEITHIDVETEEYYEYIQYNFETKEYTTIRLPVENNSQCTWELFSPAQIASMTQASQSSPKSFEEAISSPQTIIDDDNPLFLTPPTTAPYSSVALILTQRYNLEDDKRDTFMSTGFLVSDRVLVAAAHSIAPKNGWEIENIEIYFGMHGAHSELPNTFIAPLNYTVPSGWYTETNDDWKYDYAVIDLYSGISRPFYFNCTLSSNVNVGTVVAVSGYPQIAGYFYQKSSNGVINYKDPYEIHYTNDAIVGMSGGPIYNASINSTCYGVITREGTNCNKGNLFTQDAYNLIYSRIVANQ